MADLKVLGAQRIKALTEVLNDQKSKAIAALKSTLPTREDVQARVDDEFGIESLRVRLEILEDEVQSIKDEIDAVTGEFTYSTRRSEKAYNKRKVELTADVIEKPIKAIEAAYDEKARSLWLCETLEEAKKIVYGDN